MRLPPVAGHTFWCERTRTGSADVACTCTEPTLVAQCCCGHRFQDHLGNGGFCRYCTPTVMLHQDQVCLEYRAVLI